jgi:hypothetical protein
MIRFARRKGPRGRANERSRSVLAQVLRCAVISLGSMLLSTASPASEGDCNGALIQDPPPPTEEAWQLAVGPSTTQLRIKTKNEPKDWVSVYSPRWDARWLLGHRHRWPPDSLRVEWGDISRVDARVTSPAGRGMAIGGAIGAGVAIALGIACAIDDPIVGAACPLGALFIGAFTVPVGIFIGDSVASNPRWVPVLCTE